MKRIYKKNNYSLSFITYLLFIIVLMSNSPERVFANNTVIEKYEKVFATQISYGPDKERLGFITEPTMGPESFINDSKGNFYICDTVNRRVQVYSNTGVYLYSITMPKRITPNDIIIDEYQLMYIYDHAHKKLYQIGRQGKLLGSFKLDSSQWRCRRLMHIVDNHIYRRANGQNDILIGKIVDGQLINPTVKESEFYSEKKGILTSSGKRYSVKLFRNVRGIITITNDRNESVGKIIELPIKGLVSIVFLKEDKNGDFYVQIERVKDNDLFLEVRKFDSSGYLSCIVPIPDNNYMAWTAKLLSVDNDGNIWQLLPGKKNAELNIFSPIEK